MTEQNPQKDPMFAEFIRKPFVVGGVQITPLNVEEVAKACGGELRHDGKKEGNFSRTYIKVPVKQAINERQTEGHIGDWIVKQGRTFKVYPNKQFNSTFEPRDGQAKPQQEGKKPPQKRRPKQHKPKQHKPKQSTDRKSESFAKIRVPSPAQMPKRKPEPKPEPKKPTITLDELNSMPGDPRTADDIHREGRR